MKPTVWKKMVVLTLPEENRYDMEGWGFRVHHLAQQVSFIVIVTENVTSKLFESI